MTSLAFAIAYGPMGAFGGGMDGKNILGKVHDLNQHEIEMANMALEKDTSKELREYAQMLIRDHSQADQRTKELAQTLKVNLSPHMHGDHRHGEHGTDKSDKAHSMAAQHQEMMERLKGLDGREFEREFLTTMVKGHEKALEMLRMARSNLTAPAEMKPQDRQVVSFLGDLEPKLQLHRDRAETLLRKMSPTGRNQ